MAHLRRVKMTTVTRDDIRRAFVEAGCTDGDVVMFHSSLKSMGHVEGGASAVYEAVLDAVGTNGTVAVPSLWYNGNLQECPRELFDVRTSPTFVGTIPETFRQDPRAYRSDNFSHAVCAIGVRAKELTDNHGAGKSNPSPWNEQAFAEISPWSRFYEWNALYCLLGVDMNTCTMKHYIESRYVESLLRTLPPERYGEFRAKIACDCNGKPWIYYPGVKMRERLEASGLICSVKLGDTKLLSIRTAPMVHAVLEIISAAPQDWCSPQFYSWICEVRSSAVTILPKHTER